MSIDNTQVSQAITKYGAVAVHKAAFERMSGNAAPLASMGLSAPAMLDAWRLLRRAHQAMSEGEQVTEAAAASAALTTL